MLDDVKTPVAEIKKKLSMDYLFSLVDEVLEEISSGAGGSSQSAPGPIGSLYKRGTKKRKKKKTSKPRKTEVNEVSEEDLDEGFTDRIRDFVQKSASEGEWANQAELMRGANTMDKEQWGRQRPRDKELMARMLLALEAPGCAPEQQEKKKSCVSPQAEDVLNLIKALDNLGAPKMGNVIDTEYDFSRQMRVGDDPWAPTRAKMVTIMDFLGNDAQRPFIIGKTGSTLYKRDTKKKRS
jgi:hypothetical protein